MADREYIVLEEWVCHASVLVTAPNKKEAVVRAKREFRAAHVGVEPDYRFNLEPGGPTGRYEAQRVKPAREGQTP